MADHIVRHDPEEFVIPGLDLNGRGVQISVQVPPLLDQALNEIIESRKFPFETKDGAFRWCLYQGVKTLGSMHSCISVLPVLEMMLLLARTQFHMRMFGEFFDKLDRVVVNLLATGFQEHQARRLVVTISELIMCIASGSWRTLYLNELRKRLGHLLTGTDLLESELIEWTLPPHSKRCAKVL